MSCLALFHEQGRFTFSVAAIGLHPTRPMFGYHFPVILGISPASPPFESSSPDVCVDDCGDIAVFNSTRV